MTVAEFMAGVKTIILSKPSYKLGYDGRDGLCDCIGLIIGGIRRAGGAWSGTHGSNWAARNAVSWTDRIEVGAVVFKAHEPGDVGWDLPSAYNASPDQRDYYHVGVVMTTSPLTIAHCTSWSGGSGIKTDTAIGRWKHIGRLKMIDYGEAGGAPPSAYAFVVTPNPGETVNLRASPSTAGNNILSKPRDGTRVFVLEQNGEWWRVNDGSKSGWVMSKFLSLNEDASETSRLLDEIDGHVDRIKVLTNILRGTS